LPIFTEEEVSRSAIIVILLTLSHVKSVKTKGELPDSQYVFY